MRDEVLAILPEGRQRDFCERVWSQPQNVYENRLKAIDFVGMGNVLDAGCGYGQWSAALAQLNQHIYAIDIDDVRVRFLQQQFMDQRINNIHCRQDSIEKTQFKAETFDAIFCYSAIYYCDYRAVLKEFNRILKPDGKLYFCTNDLGWFVYNIVENHNPSINFNPREFFAQALQDSFEFYLEGEVKPGTNIVMPKGYIEKILPEFGYQVLASGAEGKINMTNQQEVRSFYPAMWGGLTNVYEILCQKCDEARSLKKSKLDHK